MWGHEALPRFIDALKPVSKVADIGSGPGLHAKAIRAAGNYVNEYDIKSGTDYVTMEFRPGGVDAVWCCHVAEHILDLDKFLHKINSHLIDGGLLAITVPPAKHQIVGGHVNLFNPGLLLYRLVLAGFDCSQARLGVYGYNISVIVEKKTADISGLVYDQGDIVTLAKYFPFPIQGDNFNGNITDNIRW